MPLTSTVQASPLSREAPARDAQTDCRVTAFICSNCARPGLNPASSLRERPAALAVKWPCRVQEVLVPCTGKLQPEHLLKAFEAGADLVCVIACGKDNCHYLEGSKRAERRIEYVRGLLDEVGLGRERLLLCLLPGSAKEDMAFGPGASADAGARARDVAGRLDALCGEIAGKFQSLGRSPLGRNGPTA